MVVQPKSMYFRINELLAPNNGTEVLSKHRLNQLGKLKTSNSRTSVVTQATKTKERWGNFGYSRSLRWGILVDTQIYCIY